MKEDRQGPELGKGLSGRDVWPLGAVGFILAVSAAWWTLALWSIPGAPEWLERTRAVCFNLTETGLPDAKGWLLLFGQPPTMFALLMVGWGTEVRSSLRRLVWWGPGRMALIGVGTVLFTGLFLAGRTVAEARLPEVSWGVDAPAPETYPRLDRTWPQDEGLVDHTGTPFGLASLGGRPALVTFAFGHCATLCPAVVHQARATRLELGSEWRIVVISLDPWRDTPSRLSSLVEQFELDGESDFVVSGDVEAVNASLDDWGIPRERDESTGDVTHPGIVYLVDDQGTVAYASTGGVAQMVSLARRME